MPDFVVENVAKIVPKGKIAILGLSYKGNTEDDRESPSYEIIAKLKDSGYETTEFDPHVKPEGDLSEAIDCADMILILADHDE